MSFISISTKAYAEEEKLNKLNFTMTDDESEVLGRVIQDYDDAKVLKQKSLREFNDLSVENRQDEDQKTFNSYLPQKNESDEDAWKAQTRRPTTRNKVITVAAKITANILSPHVFAQNEDDEEDKDAGKVMETIMQWVNENSNYEKVFLNSVISMLVNPCAYVYVGYEEPKYADDIGYINKNIPVSEILLGSNYIEDIQDQPYIIRDRTIDYVTAKNKWGDVENFKYVKPGRELVFSTTDNEFYDREDNEQEDRQVNEVTYWNKSENLQITWVNGIPMTPMDNKMDRAKGKYSSHKYPFIKGGYELVDEGRFAYYKSLVFKLTPEQDVLDELYNMALDGTLLNNFPPVSLIGEDVVESSVIAPGAVTSFDDPNTKLDILGQRADVNGSWNAIGNLEASMSDASQGAVSPEGLPQMTAFQTAVVEENNRVQLGLFGKMITRLVKEWGELILEDIVVHLPIIDMQKLDAGNPLRYKTILINNIETNDTTKIQFRSDLPEENITPEEDLMLQMKLLTESKKKNQTIYNVNPKLFRELKYKVRISPDTLFKPTAGILRAFNLEGYDRMVNNPLIANDQESLLNVTKDMLVSVYKPNSVEKYVPKTQAIQQQLQAETQKQDQAARVPGSVNQIAEEAALTDKDVFNLEGGQAQAQT